MPHIDVVDFSVFPVGKSTKIVRNGNGNYGCVLGAIFWSQSQVVWGGGLTLISYPPWKPAKALENHCLEDEFPFGVLFIFEGYVSIREFKTFKIITYIYIHICMYVCIYISMFFERMVKD